MSVMALVAVLVAIGGGMDWSVFERALQKALMSRKAAASDMGISEAQLSRQIRGKEHMHVERLERLPLLMRQWYHLLALEVLGIPEEVTRAAKVERALLRTRKQLRMDPAVDTTRRTA